MGYYAGNDITDDDYNIFVTGSADGTIDHNVENVTTIAGVGTGNKGYGQALGVSPVSLGTTVSATQWANLMNLINSLATHQGTVVTNPGSPVTGADIAVYNNLTTDLIAVYWNRLNAAVLGTPDVYNAQYTAPWNNQLTAEMTVSFTSVDEMRYFFNAGGHVSISVSRSGGQATQHNADWTQTCINVGTVHLTTATGLPAISLGGVAYRGVTKIGGQGTPQTIAESTGFYDLTSVDTLLFSQASVGYLYSDNHVDIYGKVVGSVLTLTVDLVDDTLLGDGELDGTLTCSLTATPSNMTPTWGTVTLGGTISGS